MSLINFRFNGISKDIISLSISVMLINTATAVVFEGTALYLRTAFSVSLSYIGILEGVVETISYFVRIFSGVVSDFIKKRKPVILTGFILLTLSKPLIAFAGSAMQVFIARSADSLGHGIQTSPREAFIADVSDKKHLGKCFGFKQSLSVIGYTIGGLFGIITLKLSNNNFKLMFLIATIPAIFGILTCVFFVNESKKTIYNRDCSFNLKFLKGIDKSFIVLMLCVFMMMLGRFSEVFLSIYACEKLSLSLSYGTSITMTYNIVSVFSAYIAGRFLDKIDKTKVLLCSILFLIISHLIFLISKNLTFFFIGIAVWGIHTGMNHITIATMISTKSAQNIRATCFGVYYVVIAISTFLATTTAGIISSINQRWIFVYGCIASVISLVLVLFFRKRI